MSGLIDQKQIPAEATVHKAIAELDHDRRPAAVSNGFEDTSSASIETAVRRLLRILYAGMELPAKTINDFIPPKEERNREIYRRHIEGARAVDLAIEYGISGQKGVHCYPNGKAPSVVNQR
jgi:hypothetical protein